MIHPLRNFQRRSAGRSNNDPFTAPNRVLDDLQFLPRIGVESIVNRNSGTIGILECCCCSSITARTCICPPRIGTSCSSLPLPHRGSRPFLRRWTCLCPTDNRLFSVVSR